MGKFAHGTTLRLGSDLIAELSSVTGPSMSVDPIDVTSHDSVGKFREFVAGLKDGGEITAEGNLISAVQGNKLTANIASGATVAIIITFGAGVVDPATFTCQGFVTAFEPSMPDDDKLSFSATFKLTGKPLLA
jgi:predicted secreted protein